MRKIRKHFLEKIVKHKLILFSLLLIISYTYIIRNDYVAADAFIAPSGEYVSILQESPVEMKITAVGNTMNSILFSIQNPEILSDAVTLIEIHDDDEVMESITLSNNNLYEITDFRGNAVELPLGEGGG